MVDFPAAARDLSAALAGEIAAGEVLQAGYPAPGRVVKIPDPAVPDISRLDCSATAAPAEGEDLCLSLNEGGDFIRIKVVTWQSQIFFKYKVYLLPRSILARVDPSQNFLAVDAYLFAEPDNWEAVDSAIRSAAGKIGARPYRP